MTINLPLQAPPQPASSGRSRATTTRRAPPSATRSSPTRASATTSPTTWSTSAGRRRAAGTARACSPYGPITLDPAAAVLHYAQEIFEGLKAYRHADGSIWTFRPVRERRAHAALGRAARAARAAERVLHRLAASSSSRSTATGCRRAPETSLYLRPFMFAKEAFLGVRPAKKVAYYLIASPAGAYFHGGVQPVSIWLSTKYARAGQGRHGRGEDRRQLRVEPARRRPRPHEHGCQQVLFLDEGKYLEELGGMNVVLVYQATARSSRPSRTRSSRASRATRCCSSRSDRGHTVEQPQGDDRRVARGRGIRRHRRAFACGTAAVITPDRAAARRGLRDRALGRRRVRARALAARGAHRHPVRPRRRPPRLADAPRRLMARRRRHPAVPPRRHRAGGRALARRRPGGAVERPVPRHRAQAHGAARALPRRRDAADGATVVVGAAMVGYDGHRGWVNYLAVDESRRGEGPRRGDHGARPSGCSSSADARSSTCRCGRRTRA